jgi:hypothetical protein
VNPSSLLPYEAEYDPAVDAKNTVDMLIQEGKDEGACADLASATISEVQNSVDAQQKILDTLDTGSDCPNKGQAAVDVAQQTFNDAQKAQADAAAAQASAEDAPITFQPKPLGSLKEGECGAFFSDPAYTQAVAAKNAAKEAANQAQGGSKAAEAGLKGAQDAQAAAIKECQCAVRKAYNNAWQAANANNDENQKAFAKGKHMQCVLDGKPVNECDAGQAPVVQAVNLAEGVPAEPCEEEAPEEEAPKENAPAVVPKCQCNELSVTPDFMQVETDMQTGTEWLTQYKISTPQGAGQTIPHPGGIISMAVRCGKWCGETDGLWKTVFQDTNLYKISHVKTFEEIPADTSVMFEVLPQNAHTDSERSYLKNFLDKGGRLMMVGEHNGCCKKENKIVTDTVKALGGGVEVRNKDGGQSVLGQKDINDLQATEGISGIQTAAWAALKVDKSVTEVLASSSNGDIFAADQMIGKGRVTIWADINPMGSSYLQKVTTKNFFIDLVHQGANFVKAVKKGGNPNAAGPCQC